jgi:exopolysaccharide production protein ExoZ
MAGLFCADTRATFHGPQACSPIGFECRFPELGDGTVIGNLQVLRGLAALGVVFYHTAFLLPGEVHTEFFGVKTFFVISGFIMCFITRHDATGFMARRVIRIVPLYWLVTLLAALALQRRGFLDPAGAGIQVRWLIESLLFAPSDRLPMHGVGWTLNFEMYFYVVFAAALLVSQRWAPVIAGGTLLTVFAIHALAPGLWLTAYYSHGYIQYFLAGMALYYLWVLANGHLPKMPTAVICVGIVVTAYATQFDLAFWNALFWTNWGAAVPVVLVAAALLSSCAGADLRWWPLILFGDASYAIYLTHTIFMELVRHWAIVDPKTGVGSMLLVVAGSVAIGVAAHLWIETPMLRFLRSLPIYGRDRARTRRALSEV